jgi:virginiamycin B lyase
VLLRRAAIAFAVVAAIALAGAAAGRDGQLRVREFVVPSGTHPHDVVPARDGGIWFTAQGSGRLGWLNPTTGKTTFTRLGSGSAPHGVIVGPDGAPWITDGALNAIVRVDPRTRKVRRFPLPAGSGYANLNSATFDKRGVLWFTGQSGVYGRLDPKVGKVRVFRAPRGEGPYGITTTPSGGVYYASLAGSYVGRIDVRTGKATVLRPPTAGPATEEFTSIELPSADAAVRQIHGRPGEVWAAESGTDKLVLVSTR